MAFPGSAAGGNIMREIRVWRKVGRRVVFRRQVNGLHWRTAQSAPFDRKRFFGAVANPIGIPVPVTEADKKSSLKLTALWCVAPKRHSSNDSSRNQTEERPMRRPNFDYRLRQLVVPLTPELRLELERVAATEDRTLASLTRRIMQSWLRDRQKPQCEAAA
jgi:hypothetical protein